MISLITKRRRFLSYCCYYATASSVAASSPSVAPARASLSSLPASAFLTLSSSLDRRLSTHQQQRTPPPSLLNHQRRYFGRNSKSSTLQHKFMRVSAKAIDENGKNEGAAASSIPFDSEEDENEQIKETTLNWIKKVVIGLNLCPFAEKPLRQDKLKVSVVRGDDDEYVAAAVIYELISRSDEKQEGTTVVVAPEFYPNDFESYMDLVQYLEEEVMEEHDLNGIVQIVPFHPQFAFAGSGDGVDNYTNRSPYPMFHILRENEVGLAVDKLGGDASKVWQRNVDLLEGMEQKFGRDAVKRIMKGESLDGLKEILRDIRGYSEKS